MVIMTAKVSKSKLIAIGMLILVVIVILAVLLGGSTQPDAPQTETSTVPEEIKTNDDRIAYLASYGWEVKQEPVQTQEVRIPTEPNEVFERYNELQKSQGFDLHEYAGKTVKRYVYEITNYPDTDEVYYVTLIVYKNSVIGADVCSAAKGGVMHALTMPK